MGQATGKMLDFLESALKNLCFHVKIGAFFKISSKSGPVGNQILRPVPQDSIPQCGDILQKIRKHIKNDRADQAPVRIVVIMDQTMTETGYFRPGDMIVSFLEGIGEIVGLLPDVVQRGCDCPPDRLLGQHDLLCDPGIGNVV